MKYKEHESRMGVLRRALALAIAGAELGNYPITVYWIARAMLESTHFAKLEDVLAIIKQCTHGGMDLDAVKAAATPQSITLSEDRLAAYNTAMAIEFITDDWPSEDIAQYWVATGDDRAVPKRWHIMSLHFALYRGRVGTGIPT